jgi:flagellar biosynthesis protein
MTTPGSGKNSERAVALDWTPDRDAAPRIVGSGRGLMAEAILATARQHGVPVVDDAALAQTLSALPLGSEIPPSLYAAVAAVLAYVYRLDGRADARP